MLHALEMLDAPQLLVAAALFSLIVVVVGFIFYQCSWDRGFKAGARSGVSRQLAGHERRALIVRQNNIGGRIKNTLKLTTDRIRVRAIEENGQYGYSIFVGFDDGMWTLNGVNILVIHVNLLSKEKYGATVLYGPCSNMKDGTWTRFDDMSDPCISKLISHLGECVRSYSPQ
jgi:hypothetical protein